MIDLQNTYTRGVMELEGVQPAIDQAAELLDRARSAGIPIIHIQHDAGEGSPTTCAASPAPSSTGWRRAPARR